MNTGMTYLTAKVRERTNLEVRSGTEVDRLELDRTRVTGVRLVSGEVVAGGEVILSAGSFGSPAILMRSGIGPAAHLAGLGIPVLADLPVGERLQYHAFYYRAFTVKRAQNAMLPAAGALVWTGSEGAADGDLDLQITVTHFFDAKDGPTGGAIVLGWCGSFQIDERNAAADRLHLVRPALQSDALLLRVAVQVVGPGDTAPVCPRRG